MKTRSARHGWRCPREAGRAQADRERREARRAVYGGDGRRRPTPGRGGRGNGTAAAMEQLPAELRREVERRRSELAAVQNERREQINAERGREYGEILPGEPYPTATVF